MNKKTVLLFIFFSSISWYQSWSQTDFSSDWEDFYSYNNVKDFTKIGSKIYALVDNAVFIYDEVTKETKKLSSVQGLSGETTSSIYYSESNKKIIIGYETGLLEIVDDKGKITIANDIQRLSLTGKKIIKHISENNNKLYISTPFAIVLYDIEKLQFGDTYFIGNNSSEVNVNAIMVFNTKIYAATETGIFIADANNQNLIDYNNWQQPQGELAGNFKGLAVFNNQLFTVKENSLFKINDNNTLQTITSLPNNIIAVKSSQTNITIATSSSSHVLDTSYNEVVTVAATPELNYTLNTAFAESNVLYQGTTSFGILRSNFSTFNLFEEIHPEGPSSNDIFSITAQNNNLWVVYGGYDNAYTPLERSKGYSHFNGENWINVLPTEINFFRDLVHVTVSTDTSNKVYISSWNDGILLMENDEIIGYWDHTNSGLEDIVPDDPNYNTIRINGTVFDSQGNLWITNAGVNNRLKKYSPNGTWTSYDLSSILTTNAFGLNELVIDKTGTKWIGTRRNGVLAYNENGDRKKALITEATKGSLPDLNVRTLAVDSSNRIWIGTAKGLVVYTNAATFFEESIYNANPIIIDDDGIAKKLLGEQIVNTIAIDGADNKWFGTETGGVLATNPSGMETLYNFNKDNSPLPSNKIVKIKVDNTNGKVYFATDKGIVAFNNNVAPFGETLGEVYAYPNPVKSIHNFVTIDGRNGTHLPRGTNVKILDSSGRLVYETNVIEGQELKGGKVIWNKTNLAGRKVASGVYIVLLTLPDRSETSSTKIAIIN